MLATGMAARTWTLRDELDDHRTLRPVHGMTRGPVQLDVGVSYGLPRIGLPASASFRRWVAAALEGRILRADLAIRLVDEREGRALNQHYRGKPNATNVLSFPAELPKGVKLPLLGDIVLCAPVIAREAREQRKPLTAHYAHLTVHGVLHLLGFDHDLERDAEVMESFEREILAGLGLPDPYV
jgi:probable rRNA maturation factor